MAANRPSPPPELAADGKSLWREVIDDAVGQGVELDARELVWLTQAGKLADQISRLEAAVADMPLMVEGSRSPVVNPLVAKLRMHRQLLAQTVARIRLDVADEAAPAGESNRFRAAALTRWGGRA